MNTVLHLTSADESDWDHAIRSARLLLDHDTLDHEDVRLLAHRHGVELVVPGSPREQALVELIEAGGTVVAGATCFDARDRPREAIAGVEVVPSGVSELVRCQSEGYNYVKIP